VEPSIKYCDINNGKASQLENFRQNEETGYRESTQRRKVHSIIDECSNNEEVEKGEKGEAIKIGWGINVEGFVDKTNKTWLN